MKRMLQTDANTPLTNTQSFVSGLVAGTTGTLVMGPTELIKVQLSVSRAMGKDRKRPGAVFASIIKENGIRGFTRGLGMTWLRDCPSVGKFIVEKHS